VVSFTLLPFYPRKKEPPLCIGQKAGGPIEQVSTICVGGPYRDSNSEASVVQAVASHTDCATIKINSTDK
jgi:hypothetical protein